MMKKGLFITNKAQNMKEIKLVLIILGAIGLFFMSLPIIMALYYIILPVLVIGFIIWFIYKLLDN